MSRRHLTLVVPAAVPVCMGCLFSFLRRRMSPRAAYNVGFTVYWVVFCFGLPLAILGRRRVRGILVRGRAPGPGERLLVMLPIVGAVGAELWPKRRAVDSRIALVMLGSAAVNGVGEELLWRGLFLEEYPDDLVRGSVWPLLGFTLWHLAPQMILPSTRGRWTFVAGSAVVGAASSAMAWRQAGLRHVLLPHVLTDACGVSAARFRLGR